MTVTNLIDFSRKLKSAYSNKSTKKIKVPVSQECVELGNRIPKNIKRFLTLMYPNMKFGILVRYRVSEDIAEQIVSDFTNFILSDCSLKNHSEAKPRYQLYDASKNISYYKWILSQLKFFYLQYMTAKSKIYKRCSNFSELIINAEDNEKMVNNIILETPEKADPYNIVLGEQVVGYVKKLSESYADKKKNCFEKCAYDLLISRLSGETGTEFSKKVGISAAAVSQWMDKLQIMIGELLDGDECSFEILK